MKIQSESFCLHWSSYCHNPANHWVHFNQNVNATKVELLLSGKTTEDYSVPSNSLRLKHEMMN